MLALLLFAYLLWSFSSLAVIWWMIRLPVPSRWDLGRWYNTGKFYKQIKVDLKISWPELKPKYLTLVQQLTKSQFRCIRYLQFISITSSCLIAFFITYYTYQTSAELQAAAAHFSDRELLTHCLIFSLVRLFSDYYGTRVLVLLLALENHQQRLAGKQLSSQRLFNLGIWRYLPTHLLNTVLTSYAIHILWVAPMTRDFILPFLTHFHRAVFYVVIHPCCIDCCFRLFFPKSAWKKI